VKMDMDQAEAPTYRGERTADGAIILRPSRSNSRAGGARERRMSRSNSKMPKGSDFVINFDESPGVFSGPDGNGGDRDRVLPSTVFDESRDEEDRRRDYDRSRYSRRESVRDKDYHPDYYAARGDRDRDRRYPPRSYRNYDRGDGYESSDREDRDGHYRSHSSGIIPPFDRSGSGNQRTPPRDQRQRMSRESSDARLRQKEQDYYEYTGPYAKAQARGDNRPPSITALRLPWTMWMNSNLKNRKLLSVFISTIRAHFLTFIRLCSIHRRVPRHDTVPFLRVRRSWRSQYPGWKLSGEFHIRCKYGNEPYHSTIHLALFWVFVDGECLGILSH
jgi:hypothetical protein